MTRPILTIACKAADLSEKLAESIRQLPDPHRAHRQERARRAYHAKLDDALGYRWTLTEAGERAVERAGAR